MGTRSVLGTGVPASAPWPDLSGLDLAPTIGTLHLFTQVVGKVRLMLTPWENHGWHVPLYVSSRGLTTGLIPASARSCSLDFDFYESALVMTSVGGRKEVVALEGCSVASFHSEVIAGLARLGVSVRIDTIPSELPDAMPFARDHAARVFEPAVARSYWLALVDVHRVFQQFRTRFSGKNSPIHLFWGAFDLAVTRFSGRAAPRHPGGAARLPDAVAREAYSREVSSAGFWPNLGGADGPCFYSYAYPTPVGFGLQAVKPAAARFDDELGEFLLPYSAVRASDDPCSTLLDFLESTYSAAAELAGWDRHSLDREQGSLGRPPAGS